MSIITLILGVVVFGSASLTGMPLEYMPDMEMPMELVMITWPGADADSRPAADPANGGRV